MPNRILKERICKSKDINSLGWFEEVLFYRLMVVADDYGRFDGDVAIIKGSCFPLKKDLTERQLDKALEKLSIAGMVFLYETEDGETILQLTAWEKHQTVRAKSSKYPEFNENNCKQISPPATVRKHMKSSASKCKQMQANVPVFENVFGNDIRERESSAGDTRAHKAFGQFENVYLSEDEFAAFKRKYPDAESRIDYFSAYLASTGKDYPNHYAKLVLWAEQDSKKNKAGNQEAPQKSNFAERVYDSSFLDSFMLQFCDEEGKDLIEG